MAAPPEKLSIESAVSEEWMSIASEAREIAQAVWSKPELGLLETHAAAVLAEWLEAHGFVVRSGVGLPTAFVAEAGDDEPAVGYLLEYDALPALSNTEVPRREIVEFNGAGHACGHNLIGTVNAAAAIVTKRVAEQLGLRGRIIALGTPAEEILVGKVAMLDAGAFNGIDILLTHHADYTNAAVSRPCQSIVHGEISFSGTPAHTGVIRAQNALDAAELLVQTLERLRAHQFAGVSLEHAIRCPTYVMPSNTPEEIRVWFYVRHSRYEDAYAAWLRVLEQAEAAAAAVGVSTEAAVISSCRGYLPNDVLGRLLFDQLQRVGPPPLDDADLGFLRELTGAFAPDESFSIHRQIAYLDEGIDAYGQDDGEVSWHIPLGRVNYACPAGIPLHSWAATSLFASEAAWKGARMCGEVLALAGTTLLNDPDLVAEAKSELTRRSPEPPPRSVAGQWDALVRDPNAFWAGRWVFAAQGSR